MLALRPFGGSLVTLTEFCNTETGNDLEGIELMKSLKLLLTLDDVSAMFNTILSRDNIQEVAK